jgi:hypothetical protein
MPSTSTPTSHLRNADHNHFVVVFRTGGIENCEWRATVPFASGRVADAKADEIRRGGRKALVKRVGEVVEHGLPVGWGFSR